ncbi:type VI secretion system ATPase TssH [Leisingera sp. JC1]|uniref:type VI secretion system ATPase TssH n=1 Tax=Leisingera sp. JC1 TaxID=1855282 RepID=UPI0008031207|nr:type VI secretion system ATPase TssH [Leisingera sp. JC1]OBY24591.1 ClpV1 family T6SS ATPase [Leisingera sp. JC1]
MTEITIEKYAGKMNRAGYDAFLQGMRQARSARNRYVDLSHWLFHSVSNQNADISVTLRQLGVDRGRLLKDLSAAMDRLDKNVTETPGISDHLSDALNHAWTYATLFFGEAQIRTGHVLTALLNDPALRRQLLRYSPVFESISAEQLGQDSRTLWAGSEEESMRPMDGANLSADEDTASGSPAKGGSTALDRFAKDMTAAAAQMDPVKGRDEEIRQLTDVLLRRRQNNPILTGEAGVGKTAVVEGFAQLLAANDVPPKLQGTRLYELDIQSMQAGASIKGEFEQRLKSVIDEVQSSPEPIILFIDEAHTLIGAGGQAGTGDAANLLKPALARGTLRTIAATTWSEYRQHIEKDPALTRRFQPVNVDEPSVEVCCDMLRGILEPMQKHHNVRISDEAIVSAVTLSHRYIPARQMPDKAVSLLDTACARVAISQSAVPARIMDTKARISALEAELAGKTAARDLGETDVEREEDIRTEITALTSTLEELQSGYAREKEIVDQVLALRTTLQTADPDSGKETSPEALRSEMHAHMAELDAASPDDRMVYAHVDAQAVASVISDWTGIPAGRMVQDELQAVLTLSDTLRERVIGQDHGLRTIAKRIEISRAGLANPNKPIGVFMLCGPSGTGKTETALALAEQLYGGEQNVITINMSEFQEAHTVSLLKGAPPGYVGYGEGGRLTEAVRRKPYSVVLLDEIEKAHPDVHELFFQVFDKGVMEDGNGRLINFKNTLILLTSNVGTDVIMDMAGNADCQPDPEQLDLALKPSLLQVFPPALLGRIVTIPYFPLSRGVLGGITRLKLAAVAERLKGAHGTDLAYGQDVLDHITAQCNDPDSGGRMIDNIITNSILPDLSRKLLQALSSGQEIARVSVTATPDGFKYTLS